MRLDKFLKVSRIIKRRTIANEACDSGRVKMGEKALRASYDVKIGDKISIDFNQKTVLIEVLSLKESTKKEDAVSMYKIIEALKRIVLCKGETLCIILLWKGAKY